MVLLGALSLRISGFGWVEDFRDKVFDYYQRIQPRAYEDAPVRVIDLDDESLAKLGQWPWPRTLVARLVDRLSDLGASAIVFDMVFAEPDRTSPAVVVKFWPPGPDTEALKARARNLPDHEKVLAKAFRSANVVTGFTLVPDVNDRVPAQKADFASLGDSPLSFVPDFDGAVANLPGLEDAALGNGAFSFVAERDGVVRRAPLIFRRGKTLLPSLTLEALRAAQWPAEIPRSTSSWSGLPVEVQRVAKAARTYSVKTAAASSEASMGQHTGIVAIKAGQFVIPTDAQGRIWVHFSPRVPRRTIPVWKVLDKGFPRSELEGMIAFVGTSAMGLMDLRVTATDPAAPGVEVHANIAEQVLLGHYLNRPDWATGAEVCFLLVLGVGLIIFLPRFGAAWCLLVSLGAIAAAVYASWHAYTRLLYLVDPVFPSLTVIAVYMTSSLVSYLKTESEKKQIRTAFGQYLSPILVEQLAQHPEKLTLGGEMRNITVHFCDVRGFTTISEQLDPKSLTQVINRFLTPMTDTILKHQGCIDKYIGDCIMAYWGAPLDDPDHASNACRAALEMHERLKALDKEWAAEAAALGRKHLPIKIGTGLNTGDCVVGNLGSAQRFDYSVLGDDVNLASRLEGQSKNYGVKIVIGPSTREKAGDFAFIELDLIRVKGKLQPVRIHALLGDKVFKESPEFLKLAGTHGTMLESYRKQEWDKALGLMDECQKLDASLQVLYDLYRDRVKGFREHAPGADWDGVFVATSK